MHLPVRTIVTVLAAALAAGACSGGTLTDAVPTAGLLGALGDVRATDQTRAYLEYGDGPRIAELAEADRDRFLRLRGLGLGSVGLSSEGTEEKLGVDLVTLGHTLQAGRPPDQGVVILGGYDRDAVESRLADLDIPRTDRDGAAYWRSADDHAIDPRRKGPFGGVALNEFNVIRTAPGSLAFGPSAAGVDAVTGAGEDGSLADDPALAGAVGCLEDVVAAIVHTPEGESQIYAVGVRASSPEDVTEVLCLAFPEAPAARDRIERELAEGDTPRGPAWSEVLPDSRVEVVGELIRITARPAAAAQAGVVFQLLQTMALTPLVQG